MARLVDPRPLAAHRAHPGHRRGLAQYGPAPTTGRYFLPLIVFWITIGTIHIILLRWIPDASWHGGLQVISDVVMVSALVYATGLQDSYFLSLYLLVIIVGSILFSRRPLSAWPPSLCSSSVA